MDGSGIGGFLSGGGISDIGQIRFSDPSLTQQPYMNTLGGLENDHHPVVPMEVNDSNLTLIFGKEKGIGSSSIININDSSEDDEPGFTDVWVGDKGFWKRMNWNDDRVRLLMTVVSCVGDDGTIRMEGHKRRNMVVQKRAKAKDDVKKILSSKHLFYKEMCAYHDAQMIPNFHEVGLQGNSLPSRRSKDNNGKEKEQAGEDNEIEFDVSDDDDHNNADRGGERKSGEEDVHFWSLSIDQLDKSEEEMARIFQDPITSLSEQTKCVKKQLLQLQEQNVNYQAEALEVEKQRLKLLRYSIKKKMELEKMRLKIEMLKLENERSILQLRQKELEIDSKSKDLANHTSLGIDSARDRSYVLGQTSIAHVQMDRSSTRHV
ncbi:Sequence-specific DNA binding transcription factor [Quillaja saponaria]|uniref:Sequence-specific DNA binding transcription factor n=1 Tax=Quillaja saponaria TaxID=32244 RepID=A0AAD7VLW4_QUISA|nr:Sequence-specific DNA binding transcription factor [Quillaja saponaria]